MQAKVDQPVRELAAIVPRDGRLLGLLQFIENGLRDLNGWIAVVRCERIEHGLVPDPVFEHLRRRLDKVTRHARASEAAEFRAGQNTVQRVAKLMEQRLDVVVREQRGLVFARSREIADERHGGPLIVAAWQSLAGDERKHREVIELTLAREHV